jgi:hypothetical protein
MADTAPLTVTSISEARTETAHASRYLQQLAKHWSHKFEVQFTPTAATIDLPLGRCELAADAEALEVTLKGTPHVDMNRFKTVVAEHLQRFGHRETLTFDWRDATPA